VLEKKTFVKPLELGQW